VVCSHRVPRVPTGRSSSASAAQLGWLQNGSAVLSAPGQEWLHRGLSCPKSARLGLRRHLGGAGGRHVTGGILTANPAAYDALSHRFLFGSLFRPMSPTSRRTPTRSTQSTLLGLDSCYLSVWSTALMTGVKLAA
jgi:hypothetical protein